MVESPSAVSPCSDSASSSSSICSVDCTEPPIQSINTSSIYDLLEEIDFSCCPEFWLKRCWELDGVTLAEKLPLKENSALAQEMVSFPLPALPEPFVVTDWCKFSKEFFAELESEKACPDLDEVSGLAEIFQPAGCAQA